MRPFSPRFLALAALVPALALFVFVPGCAKQSEGERCGDSIAASNDDCADGLVCKTISNNPAIYRCCYSDHITDSRCESTDSDTPLPDAGDSSAGSSGDADASSAGGGG